MNKRKALVFTLLIVLAVSKPVFAAEVDQDSHPSSEVPVTLSITPSYIVSIPASVTIGFNETITKMGRIQASHMQIEANKRVNVSATTGKLENNRDKAKTISYKLMDEANEFSSINLSDTLEKADLSIAITENDWNKAYGGSYKGIITFTISYENSDT